MDTFRVRHGKVLAWWLDHPAVDASALAVLAVLATYADVQGLCWPHPKTIAEKLRKSRPWVLDALNRLVEAGLVERRPRRGHSRPGTWEFVLVGYAALSPATPDAATPDAACRSADQPCQPADTEQDQQEPEESSLRDGESGVSPGTREGQGEAVDPAWVPTAADMAFAAVRRPDLGASDLALMTEKLLAHHRGRRLPDISSTWRRWLLTERTPHARRDREARRPSHDRRHEPGARPGGNDLSARNNAAARAALDRILARRADSVPAGRA